MEYQAMMMHQEPQVVIVQQRQAPYNGQPIQGQPDGYAPPPPGGYSQGVYYNANGQQVTAGGQ